MWLQRLMWAWLTWVLIVPLWNWNCGCAEEIVAWSSLNCTFMELKSTRAPRGHHVPARLNCTFMELKFHNVTFNLKAGIVLIVPLWNWNPREPSTPSRTPTRLNCTFMELKCESTFALYVSKLVLIVPLWNWNLGWTDHVVTAAVSLLYLYGIEIHDNYF